MDEPIEVSPATFLEWLAVGLLAFECQGEENAYGTDAWGVAIFAKASDDLGVRHGF